ncbi:formyl transferase [Sesbania bispinosa]|nr:formyl transferase [Sesbania bispinosa]
MDGEILAKSQTWKAKADSLSRMENLFLQVPDLDGESRLPEPDGEIILAKSLTWMAKADSPIQMEKINLSQV